MASIAEINAGFDIMKAQIQHLIGVLPSIPFVDLRSMANQKLESPEGTHGLIKGVTDILEAAEKVRAKEAAK